MQTLGLSLRAKGREGEPIPSVFPALESMGAKIRRGQLTLIAAAPGGGKTTWATTIALFADYTNHGDYVPTIYFSADSDKMTFGVRAIAGLTDMSIQSAEGKLKDQDILEYLDDRTSHLWVSFDPSPSCNDIDEEVDAFAHVYGEYPHLIVIDNLMDVDYGGGEERMGHDDILNFCKQLARRIGAAVVVLCHVTGKDEDGNYYTDGTSPIPLSGLMNKIDKRPRLVLTLYRETDTLLGVCVVKNNNGRAASDGSYRTYIPWIPERCWFKRE